jgi:dGTPase
VIDSLAREYLQESFWHERNGLRRVDHLELLEDNYRVKRNLDLTYAVRDGIISHCGEIDENALFPRAELIDLSEISEPNQYAPATWEGCAVKIADKIAYVGRDIEDAIKLGFLSDTAKASLERMAREHDNAINTTVIMHNMIIDICENSSPEEGIRLSDRYAEQLNEIKNFNYESIYKNKKFKPFMEYAALIINQLFLTLFDCYAGEYTLVSLHRREKNYPNLIKAFSGWLSVYCSDKLPESQNPEPALYENDKCYSLLETPELYAQAILDYISGMTDRYAISMFNELITY